MTVQPSGGFSLCDLQESLPSNTSLEVILSSDSPLEALSMGLVDLSNLSSDALSPRQLSTSTSPCTAFNPQALPNIQEQYWYSSPPPLPCSPPRLSWSRRVAAPRCPSRRRLQMDAEKLSPGLVTDSQATSLEVRRDQH